VVRDRGVMARLTDDGMLENVYRLQIMNNTESVQHYRLNVTGLEGLEIESEHIEHAEFNQTITVKPTESRWLIVDLKVNDGTVDSGSHKIKFEVQVLESQETVTEKSVFLVPR
jgi:polyferredoxin